MSVSTRLSAVVSSLNESGSLIKRIIRVFVLSTDLSRILEFAEYSPDRNGHAENHGRHRISDRNLGTTGYPDIVWPVPDKSKRFGQSLISVVVVNKIKGN